MSAPANPFRPGFATPPPVLAGRDDLVQDMHTITSSAYQAYGSHRVVYGSRGVGKTVLIDRFAHIGAQRQWGVVQVEVRKGGDLCDLLLGGFSRIGGVPQKLAKSARAAAHEWSERSQGIDVGVYHAEARRTHRPGDELAHNLNELWGAVAKQLASRRRGVMVLIDEAQNASADHLNMLGPILQDLSRADQPNVVVFAGLMGLPRHLVDNVSYAERLVQTKIGHLDVAATAHAIAVPAGDAGRPFDEDALELVIEATGGYPYFVQLYAYHAFESASGDRITIDDVRTGAARAHASLQDGMFRTRWQSLPASERQFLQLMAATADDSGICRIASIAAAANGTTQQFSVVRSRLIAKGLIEPSAHGELRCPQPGFLRYVAEQLDERVERPHVAVGG
jgi:hypothetical protein